MRDSADCGQRTCKYVGKKIYSHKKLTVVFLSGLDASLLFSQGAKGKKNLGSMKYL